VGSLAAVRRVLPIVLCAAALAGGGCGGDNAEDEVRATLDRFGEATRDKDYTALCEEIFAAQLVQQIASLGQPCETVLRSGLENVQAPTVDVQDVEVSGDEALATVRTSAEGQEPSEDQVSLVREDGDWRIGSLAAPQPQPPAPTAPPGEAPPEAPGETAPAPGEPEPEAPGETAPDAP
jgi:ketosteroid isomerase-like protein